MDDFKLDLTRPAPRPKTLEEAQQIIDGLWEVVGGLKARLDELEEQLQTGSDNSSRPPSQDSPKRRAERKRKRPTGRKKGAQPGHAKPSTNGPGYRRRRWMSFGVTIRRMRVGAVARFNGIVIAGIKCLICPKSVTR
ncbi:MAG: DUF6444 domain-containing protein [Methylohalobius sp. ZOD2]